MVLIGFIFFVAGAYCIAQSATEPKGKSRDALIYLGGTLLIAPLAIYFEPLQPIFFIVFLASFANLMWGLYQRQASETDEIEAKKNYTPPPPPPPEDHTQRYIEEVLSQLHAPEFYHVEIEKILTDHPPKEEYLVNQYVRYINAYFSFLPNTDLLTKKNPIHTFSSLIPLGVDEDVDHTICFMRDRLGEDMYNKISSLKIGLTLPEKIRTQHHHIVGGTGHGKTELLKSMILDDVEAGHSVIVIDSQNDMINELATKIPPERLILVDPIHCPPALNLFKADTSSELFEYIFSALDAQMTSKQGVAYRFVSQMVVKAGGNIHTMRKILEPGDLWRKYIDGMGETANSFFETEYSSRQFNETRQQILRRLYTVLENDTLEKMLGAKSNSIDIAKAIDSGKVLLISTAKSDLKQTSASLLGRIFIAQVMQAVMSREGGVRKRTYFYIDEFQDYAEDSHVLFNLFEQARKYELGLIIAHQYLGQLPAQLQQSLSANTAIKFAGGVSADDARKLAGQMKTTPEYISNQAKGTFASWVKECGTIAFGVELGRSAKTPDVSSLSAIRDTMRKRFAEKKEVLNFEPGPRVPLKKRKGPPDVPEKGEW